MKEEGQITEQTADGRHYIQTHVLLPRLPANVFRPRREGGCVCVLLYVVQSLNDYRGLRLGGDGGGATVKLPFWHFQRLETEPNTEREDVLGQF